MITEESLFPGPTENWVYKIGRYLAGFHQLYKDFDHASESSNPHHHCTIYDIESTIKKMGLKLTIIKTLYPPVPIFQIDKRKEIIINARFR